MKNFDTFTTNIIESQINTIQHLQEMIVNKEIRTDVTTCMNKYFSVFNRFKHNMKHLLQGVGVSLAATGVAMGTAVAWSAYNDNHISAEANLLIRIARIAGVIGALTYLHGTQGGRTQRAILIDYAKMQCGLKGIRSVLIKAKLSPERREYFIKKEEKYKKLRNEREVILINHIKKLEVDSKKYTKVKIAYDDFYKLYQSIKAEAR